jgi:hypothetical protein
MYYFCWGGDDEVYNRDIVWCGSTNDDDIMCDDERRGGKVPRRQTPDVTNTCKLEIENVNSTMNTNPINQKDQMKSIVIQ